MKAAIGFLLSLALTWRPTTAAATPRPRHEGQEALRRLQGRDPEEVPGTEKVRQSRKGATPLVLVLSLISLLAACSGDYVSENVKEASVDPHLEFAQFLTTGISDDVAGIVITAVHPDEMGLEYQGAMTVPGTEMLAYRGPFIPNGYRFARSLLNGLSTKESSYLVFVRDPERMAEKIPPEEEITGVFPVKGGGMLYQVNRPASGPRADEPSFDNLAASASCYVTDWENPLGDDEFGMLGGPRTARAREYQGYIDCIIDLLDLIKDERCVVAKTPVWNSDTEVNDMEAAIVCDPLLWRSADLPLLRFQQPSRPA